MNKALILFGFISGFFTLTTMNASGQSGVNFQKAPEEAITLPARTPVAYVPIGMPVGGIAIRDEDGNIMDFYAYQAKLNDAEKKLNTLGFSVREDNDTSVLESTLTPDALQKQTQANINQGGVGVGGPSSGGTSRTRSFVYEIGSSSALHGKLWGDLTVAGSGQSLNVAGNAACSGGIMGHDWTLAQASGQVQHKGTSFNERFKLQLGGSTIVDLTHSGITVFSSAKDYATQIQREASFKITLGPVPVHCKVGLAGAIGVGWNVAVQTASVTGSVTPHSEITGYADASIDVNLFILKVTAGVNVSLVFLRYGGALTGVADIGRDSKGTFVETNVSYTHTLNMLSGTVSFYTKLRYWLWKWRSKTWTWTLWSWKGFQSSGTVFNIHDKAYIPLP